MHAYLIIGVNKEEIEKSINDLVAKLQVSKLPISIQSIDDVRTLNKYVHLSKNANHALVIEQIDQASTEAMNAFLKNLEEAKNNYFILTANSIYNILPTILSRCQVIRTNILDSGQDEQNSKLATDFINKNLSEKFKFIDTLKKRDEAKEFIFNFILGAHYLLNHTQEEKLKIARYLRSAQITLNRLNLNGNVNLQLTNFIVSTN